MENVPIILRFLERSVGICKGPKYMAKNRVSWYYQVNTGHVRYHSVYSVHETTLALSCCLWLYFLISLSLTNCTKWTLLTAVTWSYTKNSNHRFITWARTPHCLEEILLSIFFPSEACPNCADVKHWSWNLAGVGAKHTSYTTISVSGYGLMPHLSLQFYWLDALGCSCWTCALHMFSHTKMMTSGRSLDLAALSRPLQSSYTPSHSSQRGPSIPDRNGCQAVPSSKSQSTPNLPEPRWQWPRKRH